MSNRDIATELGVGERTVEVHLTRTYRKLGVRNRRALIEECGEELSGGPAGPKLARFGRSFRAFRFSGRAPARPGASGG